jgi:hypothetical protein
MCAWSNTTTSPQSNLFVVKTILVPRTRTGIRLLKLCVSVHISVDARYIGILPKQAPMMKYLRLKGHLSALTNNIVVYKFNYTIRKFALTIISLKSLSPPPVKSSKPKVLSASKRMWSTLSELPIMYGV